MNALHRYNTKERQHYLLGSHYSFRLRPQLLYVGSLTKQPGWRDEPHKHEFAEILLVKDGIGTVHVNGVMREAVAGDILVYNAGIVHDEISSIENPMELVFFALDKVNITDLEPNCLLPPDYDFLVHTGEMYDIFCSQFDTMLYEMRQKERFYHEIAQNVSRTFIMYLFRLLNKTTQEMIIKSNDGYRAALQYINEHFLEPLSLETIARSCFINKYYLSHLFAREQDISIGQYIIKRRIEEGMHLLSNTNHPVNKVAELSGFNDFSYFCRCFKKIAGMTPAQYRRKGQK